MKCAPLVALLLSLVTVCTANAVALSPTPATATSLNKIAEAYVKLVLALGQHDPDYVDAYYGPPEWKQQLQGKKPLDSDRKSTRLNSSHITTSYGGLCLKKKRDNRRGLMTS